jgi:hypothetical protein
MKSSLLHGSEKTLKSNPEKVWVRKFISQPYL